MKKLLSLPLLPALVSCGGEETHAERHTKLRQTHKVTELCTSQSQECITWTKLELKCIENLENNVTGSACTQAETYRENVTGIELSTDPGAYSFRNRSR